MVRRLTSNDIGVQDKPQYSPKTTPTRKGSKAQDGSKQEATPKNQVEMETSGGQSCGHNTREQITAMFPGLTVTSAVNLATPLPSPPPDHPSYSASQMANMTATNEEFLHDIYNYLANGPGGLDAAECFVAATAYPHVTRDSLSELNTHRFINNPKLRHDINFDRDLHFRPNLDGAKGKQKMRSADTYWKALSAEFYLYFLVHTNLNGQESNNTQAYWLGIRRHAQRRLPTLFSAIRDVLKTLVPDIDRSVVVERLDVDFLMQQIENGVCDLVDLADWFATILKRHCAPMRDYMVDKMRLEIRAGVAESDVMKLVEGLRQLVTILEAMKLDLANHQIRHIRSLLIDDTVNFHRRHGAYRVGCQKIDAIAAKQWFDDSYYRLSARKPTQRPRPLEAFTAAVFRGLLGNDYSRSYPQTFYMDYERLRSYQEFTHRQVYLQICCLILRDMVDPFTEPQTIDNAEKSLYTTISSIVGAQGNFRKFLGNIAVEIMRHVNQADGRDSAIDPKLLNFIEYKVDVSLSSSANAFELGACDVEARILPQLQAEVARHSLLSAVTLQERLVPTSPSGRPSHGTTGGIFTSLVEADADLIRRMTHMIVLHWQIWAELTYLVPLPQGDSCSPYNVGPSPPPSPTMPVSQAHYSPGGKFLPIRISTTEVSNSLPSPAPSPNTEPQLMHATSLHDTMAGSDLDDPAYPPGDPDPSANA